jgi:hypothetical protein
MWYLIRTMFFFWLSVSTIVLHQYKYFPEEIGIILTVGFFMATAVSFADIMVRDKL